MGEALSMGWCLAIIQKALLCTIVSSMLWENHAPSTLNTSFVDLEIEWAHCNSWKKKTFCLSLTLYSLSVSVKRRRLGWPTPALSQTSSTRLTHTFPHFYVILHWTCSRPAYLWINVTEYQRAVKMDRSHKTKKTKKHNNIMWWTPLCVKKH